MKHPFLARQESILSREESAVKRVRATRPARILSGIRKELLALIKEVTSSGELWLIIAIEIEIVRGDLDRYANSREMSRSLGIALEELAAVERHLSLVADPAKYSLIDQGHSLRKKRENGLPLDDARAALASHLARLRNLDKSRLDEEEKELIEGRKASMAASIHYYAALQKKALRAAA